MNTMEFTKYFGAATAALLVFLLAGFASQTIYATHGPEELAYALEIAEPEGAAEADAGPDFATLLASVDPADGAAVFRKCAACHKIEDGANGVGPHLYGVVGRDVGSVPGFGYSGALTQVAQVWTFDELNAFLENPKGYAPGTSMGFAGLAKVEERAEVIAYLNAEGPSPLPLPEPQQAAEQAEVGVELATPTEENALADEAPAAESEVAAADPDPAEQPAQAETAPEAEAVAEAETAPEAQTAPEATAEAAPEAAAPAEPEAEPTLAAALANPDMARGEEVFAGCALCHTLTEGAHGIGPSLLGVVGQPVAGVARFPYSDALAGVGGDWTAERLDALLADPASFGGHAGYPALTDQSDRADVLAYLNAATPDAAPLQAAEAPAAEAAPTEEAPAEAGSAAATPAEPAPSAEAPAEAAPAAEAPAAAGPAPETAESPAAESDAAVAEQAPAAEEAPAAGEEAPAAEEETETAAAAPAPEAAPAPAPAPSSDDPFVAAYLAATVDDGQKVFRKCGACHRVEEGRNGVGPSLYGVVGRDIGAIEGFRYSDTLAGMDGAWTPENLAAFLENPKGWAPGTKMAFAGLRTVEERAAVVKYLNEVGGSPVPVQ